MDDELKGLLDGLKKNHKTNVKTRQEELSAEDAWVAKFDELRRTVIRPTLEKLGEQIRSQEHDFNIVEVQFNRQNRAIPIEASIRMDIYLATERTRTGIGTDRRPFLGFTTHHRSEMVQVSICDITARGGVISKIGEYPLDKVDAVLVREKFIALFKRLLAQQAPAA
jgi:hypothetical protein